MLSGLVGGRSLRGRIKKKSKTFALRTCFFRIYKIYLKNTVLENVPYRCQFV